MLILQLREGCGVGKLGMECDMLILQLREGCGEANCRRRCRDVQVRDKEEPSDVAEDVEMCRLGSRKNLVMSQM